MNGFADVQYILNGFLLVISGAFVMWMAAGFAMLEAGLTQAKNNSIILVKNTTLFAIACITYYFIGYNLMYGEGNAFLGSFGVLEMTTRDDHPLMADFFFQVVFVATTASVVSGSIAERMKLWSFTIFIFILTTIIYPIQGHWSWGGSELGGVMSGFSDFAGSTIVHSVGGWAALAGVLLLGPRKGKYTKSGKVKPIPGSNLPLATLGTFILWFGWFGFNGGSQLALGGKSDIDAISLVVSATNMAASTGAIVAMILSQIVYKKVDLTMILNGALGGLVAITAGPNIGMGESVIVGTVAAFLVIFCVPFFDKLKLDDPVGALSVHLVNGIWGTLAVGIFSSEVAFIAQLKGVIIVGLFTFCTSYATWFILKKTIGLRVSEEEEYDGSDIHECGLEAYPYFYKM